MFCWQLIRKKKKKIVYARGLICLPRTKKIGKLAKMCNYIASYKKIEQLIHNRSIDVLHTEWYTFSPIDYLFLRKIKKKYGVKYVATVHDILPFNEKFYDKCFHKNFMGLRIL